jgi:predicted kinase
MKQMHYLFTGYPFSGKSTLIRKLQERFGFEVLSIDEIKFEMGYKEVIDDDVPDKVWSEAHKEIDRRLVAYLKEGKTVLNDNAWMKKEWRDGKRRIASDLGIETKIIFTDTPEDIVRERWQKNRQTKERHDVPDNIFEEGFLYFEKPKEDENVIVYSPETDFDTWVLKYFS